MRAKGRLSGIFTKRESFRLHGVIEDRLQFRCDNVGPVGKNNVRHELQPSGAYDSLYKIIFRLHPIELIPTGLDTSTTDERNRFYAQIQKHEDQVQ